jgi:hypothetical protein
MDRRTVYIGYASVSASVDTRKEAGLMRIKGSSCGSLERLDRWRVADINNGKEGLIILFDAKGSKEAIHHD